MAQKKKKPAKAPARPASADYLLCAQPEPTPVVLPPGLDALRALAIQIGAKKWINGTVLHYHFPDRITAPKWKWVEPQKAVVRGAFDIWKGLGIGLSFVEVADASEAEILIGCEQNNRSWSYVGTDTLGHNNLGRTMNFGWDLTTNWGKATAIHEIGHAIGLSHEHQNPKSGIVWDEDKVHAYFSGPPNNWPATTIVQNILRKLNAAEIDGSDWDPLSIMEYPFGPGLIKSPQPYDTQGVGENTALSAADKEWVRRWYPATGAPVPIAVMQFERIPAAAGSQSDFLFKPAATRKYKVQTAGESDCRLVIFEVRDGEPRHHVAEDDSGRDANASIRTKLIKGRTYLIRVRVNFAASADGLGLLVS
jgi:hypothetical protein